MRQMITAAASAVALMFALPASAGVTYYQGGFGLDLLIYAEAAGLGGAGSGAGLPAFGFGPGEFPASHGYEFGLGQVTGPEDELLAEYSGGAKLTMDVLAVDGSAMTAVATGTGLVTSYVPDVSAYFIYDYLMEYLFVVDRDSRLNLAYEDAAFVTLYGSGGVVFDLDLSGQNGLRRENLTAGVYYLQFRGNAGPTVFLENAGSASRTNTTTYNLTIAAVPEPTTWALVIMGFGGVGATLRRRRLVPQLND